jgi:4-hydroxybenzoate polyprenyltransferase
MRIVEHKTLESAAANYPYLQGLWSLPMGFLIVLTGVSNLEHRPSGPPMLVIVVIVVSLALAAGLLITRYYRDHDGEVTPTRKRQIRSGIAVAAWIVVLAGATKLLSWLLGPPYPPMLLGLPWRHLRTTRSSLG